MRWSQSDGKQRHAGYPCLSSVCPDRRCRGRARAHGGNRRRSPSSGVSDAVSRRFNVSRTFRDPRPSAEQRHGPDSGTDGDASDDGSNGAVLNARARSDPGRSAHGPAERRSDRRRHRSYRSDRGQMAAIGRCGGTFGGRYSGRIVRSGSPLRSIVCRRTNLFHGAHWC